MNKERDNLQNERELIYLLLHDKRAIDYFLNSGLSYKNFYEDYQSIILFILETYDLNDVLLTRKSFYDKLKQFKIPKDRISQELSFNLCYVAKASIDDLPLFINKILEESIQSSINKTLDVFKINFTNKDNIYAIKQLINDCQDILDGTKIENEKSYFEDIRVLSRQRTRYIKDVIDGNIKEESLILSGIKEIDYTMVTGFEKGTLTLICADVSVYKSTMMINIGLNVWRAGHDVLFVPLEMHRDQMWRRVCAREARLDSQFITRNIKDLTPEQFGKIEKMNKNWGKIFAKFYIMQESGNTTVAKIQRQIERNIELLNPKLVVIDYVANLEPGRNRYGRNDLEIGDMLKSMRQMGKDLNFAVLSAAQLGREALKRLRKAGANRDKPTINSEDIRGSHEYAADADNIYAQLKSTSQPNELLDLYVVKSRNGPTSFEDGKIRATLNIYPTFGLITSPIDYNEIEEDDILGDMIDIAEKKSDAVSKGAFFEEDDDIFDHNNIQNDDTNDIIQSMEENGNKQKGQLPPPKGEGFEQ